MKHRTAVVKGVCLASALQFPLAFAGGKIVMGMAYLALFIALGIYLGFAVSEGERP